MMEKSKILFEKAKQIIPGGVNSPVRAFQSVGGDPVFIDRANGANIYDVEGNSYIDYVCSWGPMILGHNNEKIRKAVVEASEKGLSFGASTESEVQLAEKIIEFVPQISMIRMVNSGTEAVMSAVRLARGYTGREKIIKFEGCYHGHSDSMLVKAGSGALITGTPDSLGVQSNVARDTLIAVYNDLERVENLLKEHEVACIIVEPVAANMGVVAPKEGFLKGLRRLCDEHEALLIFDEVITGFRLSKGGAQEYYGIKADLVTYGKIIGGGMPVGAYGGRKEIMEYISPCGPVYQAGTLSGNPVAMAAGLAQLSQLENDAVYRHISNMGERLEKGFSDIIKANSVKACVTRVGSLVGLFFGIDEATNYGAVKDADRAAYSEYFKKMLQNGIYLAPAQFEAMFISYSHTEKEIDKTLNVAEQALKNL